jgi:hypothetical protein
MTWYNIFNRADFLAEELPSRTLTVTLSDIGEVNIELFVGNELSMVYDGVLLPVNFLEENPYSYGGYSVYVDGNDDVWLGIAEEE